MKIYETDFEIRFLLLIRVKKVIIGGTGEGLGCREKPPKLCPNGLVQVLYMGTIRIQYQM